MVSADAMHHIERKQALLKAIPDVAEFEGPFRPSMLLIFLLVGVQWCLWYYVQNFVESYWVMGTMAWLNATTVFYSLSTFIHENSHGLCLGRVNGMDTRLFVAACIEAAFCSFGEQWEYTIVHNHLHHPHLNDGKKDSECPDVGHVAVQPTNFMKYLVPWIELLPLGTLVTQGQLSNNAMHQDYSKMEFPVNVLRVVTIAVFGTLIYNEWYHAALFAVWTTSLYSSRWCIALHGQSIAEHYRVNRSAEKEDDDKPTNSTYHMAENLLGFNTGYHDEHHTFPKVSWYYLPALKKKFPEEFVNTNNLRYTTLWMEWAMTGFDTGHFRVCHK